MFGPWMEYSGIANTSRTGGLIFSYGTYQQDTNGEFSGKVGNVAGSSDYTPFEIRIGGGSAIKIAFKSKFI